MNFLGIGPLELLIALVVALLVLGPERMVSTARKVGKTLGQVRKATQDLPSLLEDIVEGPSQPRPAAPSGTPPPKNSAPRAQHRPPTSEAPREATPGAIPPSQEKERES
ncbi:MAG: twin-arginine translocase TatA/TatE family subunit [Chloroflexi bacterium]|nr:twin-arginine translocase TatA/TatE family subunit [Chloroflexota bacterium]